MSLCAEEISAFITATVQRFSRDGCLRTEYRTPLVGFASAKDPGFLQLRDACGAAHMVPEDLLTGARSVASFFLPFARWVVEANAQHGQEVAPEWAVAYVETNRLIVQTTDALIEALDQCGIRAAAEPPTHNFDPETLTSRWSHKSVAVIAGIGSFGLHQMVITDAGCAGRFGSLVLDADICLPPIEPRQRCLYFHNESCMECVVRCPVGALSSKAPIDKKLCYGHLLGVADLYRDLGVADACGKCAIGPCSFRSAVD